MRVGYGGLSIEAIAADARVARTTIDRRYPSKRDLVNASLQQAMPFPQPAVSAANASRDAASSRTCSPVAR